MVQVPISEETKANLLNLYSQKLIDGSQLTKLGIALPDAPVPKLYEEQTASQKLAHDLSLMKWISSTIRTVVIIGVIALLVLGGIWAWGYFKGKGTVPIQVTGIEGLVGQYIPIDHGFLTFTKEGEVHIVDTDKKTILKVITAKDLPELRKKIAQVGLVLEPFMESGVAVGGKKGAKLDIGVGANFFKFYKLRIGAWLSNNGVFAGVNYKITNNFSVGCGIGKGYKSSTIFGINGVWKF
jgi:hypothetical protein